MFHNPPVMKHRGWVAAAVRVAQFPVVRSGRAVERAEVPRQATSRSFPVSTS